VVPGAARLLVDVRGEALDSPDELVSRLREEAGAALAGSEVSLAVDDDVWDYGPVAFDPALLDALREAAARTGSGSLDMVSPAGHDAGYVARVVPTAMLFVPCRDGLSHHPAEWAEPAHLELATRVLADALAELAA
jgi:N-carbamoyl-L-amino-acid hydrolase